MLASLNERVLHQLAEDDVGHTCLLRVEYEQWFAPVFGSFG